MTAIGNLHGRRIGVTIYRNHLDPKPLQLNNNFFAKLTGTAEHDPGRSW